MQDLSPEACQPRKGWGRGGGGGGGSLTCKTCCRREDSQGLTDTPHARPNTWYAGLGMTVKTITGLRQASEPRKAELMTDGQMMLFRYTMDK